MNNKELANLALQLELNDIDAEIERMNLVIFQTADDDPNLASLLIRLGASHDDRFDIVGDPRDIDKAIEYTSMALNLSSESDQDFPGRLANQGGYYGKRFQRLGELNDSDKAIEYVSLAIALTAEGHPSFPTLLANLGVFYVGRFKRVGQLSDLETAIEYKSRAVELTPEGHPDLSARLQNLGLSLRIRCEHLGEVGDLDKAIKQLSRAVSLTPYSHPLFSTLLQSLGSSLRVRYERLGELGDLERAIELESRAVTMTPDSHPEFSARLQNLGMSHTRRFERLGELRDLEEAVTHLSRAVALIPYNHPQLSSLLQNLGMSLAVRYLRLGEQGDLKRAIENLSRAVTLTPDGHPHLPTRLMNLGVFHTRRYERLGEIGDLGRAIELQSRAVELTPDGHPHLSTLLQNLGVSLRTRFMRLGALGDLESAIRCESRGVAMTPDGHPDLSSRLHNLGISHFYRYNHLQEQADLEAAIAWTSCSIELLPHGHPQLSDNHFNLASYRYFQYRLMGDPSDLQDSLSSYRIASQSSSGSPRQKFTYAIGWAKCASEDGSFNPIEAYQTAIDLLPQFIWLGATTSQRYEDLTRAGTLAIDAAVAAIQASSHTLALEWLEHARCVVWNQSLMLRSPLDELHSCDPALATQIQTVAHQLHYAGSESRESQSLVSDSLTPEQIAQKHRQLAREYDNLIAQARTVPGFTDFFQPIKAKSLVRASRHGPVAVINCHESRCDALLIIPGQDHVHHIPLPNFTGKKARHTRGQMESAIRDTRRRERGAELWSEVEKKGGFETILANLWYDIVKPVLDYLGFTNDPQPANLPHITWCPTGALSFLPLHAAGDYEKSGSRVYNYVISSYTPTLTAILPSNSKSPPGVPRVLAVGQPNTPGHTRLPGTAKELGHLSHHASDKLEYTQLIGNQATTKSVLDAMELYDWVHLACHAHQNVQDSTKSGFFLHDGTLDLAAINRRSFKNKGLAFLSACQTATGDEKLPDEAIHLASGMLMAGYSSVVGTMWSVMDDDAPFVADKVYGRLMKDGKIGNGEAGKALHYAVAELRERIGERKFGRWVPYIHIGR